MYRIDTPIYYNQKGDNHKVRESLKYIYKPYAVENKAMEIQKGADYTELKDPDTAYGSPEEPETVSYKDIFCNSLYWRATIIGLLLTVFQQMTGVNIIYFYSNQILANVGIDPGISTFIVQGVSVFGVFSGMVMTGYLGRKTILFVFSLVMSAFLIGLGISLQIDSGKMPIVLVSGFCFVFQASSGPVTWLYMAEVMQEKGLSIGTVLNWLFTLLMSFVTPTIKNAFGITGVGYLFIICGAITVGASLFMLFVLKETKGKNLAERKALFSTKSTVE